MTNRGPGPDSWWGLAICPFHLHLPDYPYCDLDVSIVDNAFHLSLGETRAWPQLCRVFVYNTEPVDDEVPFDNVAQGPYQVRVNVFQTMLFFQDFPSRLNGSRYSCERQGTWVRDIFDLHWVTVFLKGKFGQSWSLQPCTGLVLRSLERHFAASSHVKSRHRIVLVSRWDRIHF